MKKKLITLLVWLFLISAGVYVVMLGGSDDPVYRQDFASFLADLDNQQVEAVRINNGLLTVKLWRSDERYETLGVVDEELTAKLWDQGVEVSWGEESKTSNLLMIYVVVIVVVVTLMLLLFKRAGRNMMGGAISSGGSSASRPV